MSDQNTVLEFATRFASQGYWVFPMYSSSSGPQKPFGWARNVPTKDVPENQIIHATCDPEVVKKWPEIVEAGYPGRSIVAYGILGLNCVIFDLDLKDGKNGAMRFKELQELFNIPAPNLICKSKSGGFHLFYGRPESMVDHKLKSVSNLKLGDIEYTGVDVRGDGGMVVGPTVECEEMHWQKGIYAIVKGNEKSKLSTLPIAICSQLSTTTFTDPMSKFTMAPSPQSNDIFEVLKRGEIPTKLPYGARNQGFFIFINALRNKGLSADTCKQFAMQLVSVTEGQDDLHESVDIDDMISRVYQVDINNPFDVAKDLIAKGLYRVTGHGSRIKYVIFEDNPYINSTSMHDLSSLTQLLSKFARVVPQQNGKEKIINPATLIDKQIDASSDVDLIGFKPGGGKIFQISEMGGRRFLNTWKDPRSQVDETNLNMEAWNQFLEIVRRIFGPEGSDEFQLGLDYPAWLLQKPGKKPVIVPFIISRNRGAGKSRYLAVMKSVFGCSMDGTLQARSLKIEDLSNRFFNPNEASLLMLDEVQFPAHRNTRQEATSFWKHLKSLVTDTLVPIEIKGGGTFEVPNLSGLIMCGNSANNFPIEEGDRRIWIIDNAAPTIPTGTADLLYDLTDPYSPVEERLRTVNTIRYMLLKHQIKFDLSQMRAPMNDIKREMYDTGLTDIESWFVNHFENPDNLLAKTPIVTEAMIEYCISLDPKMCNTRWAEQPSEAIRELRRRNMISSVRVPGRPSQTRQLTSYPDITNSGQVIVNDRRACVYTTREHGVANNYSNEFIKENLKLNADTVQKFKLKSLADSKSKLAN